MLIGGEGGANAAAASPASSASAALTGLAAITQGNHMTSFLEAEELMMKELLVWFGKQQVLERRADDEAAAAYQQQAQSQYHQTEGEEGAPPLALDGRGSSLVTLNAGTLTAASAGASERDGGVNERRQRRHRSGSNSKKRRSGSTSNANKKKNRKRGGSARRNKGAAADSFYFSNDEEEDEEDRFARFRAAYDASDTAERALGLPPRRLSVIYHVPAWRCVFTEWVRALKSELEVMSVSHSRHGKLTSIYGAAATATVGHSGGNFNTTASSFSPFASMAQPAASTASRTIPVSLFIAKVARATTTAATLRRHEDRELRRQRKEKEARDREEAERKKGGGEGISGEGGRLLFGRGQEAMLLPAAGGADGVQHIMPPMSAAFSGSRVGRRASLSESAAQKQRSDALASLDQPSRRGSVAAQTIANHVRSSPHPLLTAAAVYAFQEHMVPLFSEPRHKHLAAEALRELLYFVYEGVPPMSVKGAAAESDYRAAVRRRAAADASLVTPSVGMASPSSSSSAGFSASSPPRRVPLPPIGGGDASSPRHSRFGATFGGESSTFVGGLLPHLPASAEEEGELEAYVGVTNAAKFEFTKRFFVVSREVSNKKSQFMQKKAVLLTQAVIRIANQTVNRLFHAWRGYVQRSKVVKARYRALFLTVSTTAFVKDVIGKWRGRAKMLCAKRDEARLAQLQRSTSSPAALVAAGIAPTITMNPLTGQIDAPSAAAAAAFADAIARKASTNSTASSNSTNNNNNNAAAGDNTQSQGGGADLSAMTTSATRTTSMQGLLMGSSNNNSSAAVSMIGLNTSVLIGGGSASTSTSQHRAGEAKRRLMRLRQAHSALIELKANKSRVIEELRAGNDRLLASHTVLAKKEARYGRAIAAIGSGWCAILEAVHPDPKNVPYFPQRVDYSGFEHLLQQHDDDGSNGSFGFGFSGGASMATTPGTQPLRQQQQQQTSPPNPRNRNKSIFFHAPTPLTPSLSNPASADATASLSTAPSVAAIRRIKYVNPYEMDLLKAEMSPETPEERQRDMIAWLIRCAELDAVTAGPNLETILLRCGVQPGLVSQMQHLLPILRPLLTVYTHSQGYGALPNDATPTRLLQQRGDGNDEVDNDNDGAAANSSWGEKHGQSLHQQQQQKGGGAESPAALPAFSMLVTEPSTAVIVGGGGIFTASSRRREDRKWSSNGPDFSGNNSGSGAALPPPSPSSGAKGGGTVSAGKGSRRLLASRMDQIRERVAADGRREEREEAELQRRLAEIDQRQQRQQQQQLNGKPPLPTTASASTATPQPSPPSAPSSPLAYSRQRRASMKNATAVEQAAKAIQLEEEEASASSFAASTSAAGGANSLLQHTTGGANNSNTFVGGIASLNGNNPLGLRSPAAGTVVGGGGGFFSPSKSTSLSTSPAAFSLIGATRGGPLGDFMENSGSFSLNDSLGVGLGAGGGGGVHSPAAAALAAAGPIRAHVLKSLVRPFAECEGSKTEFAAVLLDAVNALLYRPLGGPLRRLLVRYVEGSAVLASPQGGGGNMSLSLSLGGGPSSRGVSVSGRPSGGKSVAFSGSVSVSFASGNPQPIGSGGGLAASGRALSVVGPSVGRNGTISAGASLIAANKGGAGASASPARFRPPEPLAVLLANMGGGGGGRSPAAAVLPNAAAAAAAATNSITNNNAPSPLKSLLSSPKKKSISPQRHHQQIDIDAAIEARFGGDGGNSSNNRAGGGHQPPAAHHRTLAIVPPNLCKHLIGGKSSEEWRRLLISALFFSQLGPTCGAFRTVATATSGGYVVTGGQPQQTTTSPSLEALTKLSAMTKVGASARKSIAAAANITDSINNATPGTSPRAGRGLSASAKNNAADAFGSIDATGVGANANSSNNNNNNTMPHPLSGRDMRAVFAERTSKRDDVGATALAQSVAATYMETAHRLIGASIAPAGTLEEAARVYDAYCAASPDVFDSRIISQQFLVAKLRIIFGRDSTFWRQIVNSRSMVTSVAELQELAVTLAPGAGLSPAALCQKLLGALDDVDLFHIAAGSEAVQEVFASHLTDLSVIFSLYAKGEPPNFVVDLPRWMALCTPFLDSYFSPDLAEQFYLSTARRFRNADAKVVVASNGGGAGGWGRADYALQWGGSQRGRGGSFARGNSPNDGERGRTSSPQSSSRNNNETPTTPRERGHTVQSASVSPSEGHLFAARPSSYSQGAKGTAASSYLTPNHGLVGLLTPGGASGTPTPLLSSRHTPNSVGSGGGGGGGSSSGAPQRQKMHQMAPSHILTTSAISLVDAGDTKGLRATPLSTASDPTPSTAPLSRSDNGAPTTTVGGASATMTTDHGLDLDGLCNALCAVVAVKMPNPLIPLEQRVDTFITNLLVPIVGSKVKDSRRRADM